jgi:hypothetical protein
MVVWTSAVVVMLNIASAAMMSLVHQRGEASTPIFATAAALRKSKMQ